MAKIRKIKTVTIRGGLTKKEEKEYFNCLNRVLDDLYEEALALDLSWKDLAKRAKVSYLTVTNLGNRITRFPRFITVYKIGKAVGWDIQMRQTVSRTKMRKAI